LEWARTALIFSNGWEVFEAQFNQISRSAGGNLAFEALLKDVVKAEYAAQAKPELDRMVARLVHSAGLELELYETTSAAQADARKKRLTFDWPKDVRRPAEIYRSFASPLRFAKAQGYEDAGHILIELDLAQSLPFDELDHPGWIDSYTGEIDLEEERPMAIKARQMVVDPAEIIIPKRGYFFRNGKKEYFDITPEMAEELRTNCAAGLKALDGFNADADEEIEWYDETDINEPVWMKMGTDLVPTDEVAQLKKRGRSRLEAAQKKIEELHDQDAFRISKEAGKVMGWLQAELDQLVPVQDVALMFLSLQTDFGFAEEDALNLFVAEMGEQKGWRTLSDWLDHFGDEFLSQFFGEGGVDTDEILHFQASMKADEMRADLLDAFSKQTIQMYAAMGNASSKDINQHPAFLKGYFEAMCGAKDIAVRDEDGFRNLAVEAGWDAYRQDKSKEGNLAFWAAKKSGADNKTAMKAFWRIANASKPTIVQPFEGGLKLSTGRVISWHIAKLKLEKNELDIPKEMAQRLLVALKGREVGQAIWPFLEAI
jgi:hypothetical protein